MPRVLIPTRNRPASLAAVLRFIATFFPATKVVIADGSAENYRPQNRAALEEPARSLSVDYRTFDAQLPYFDRVLEVLRSLDDEVLVMGADDDYPQMDVLAEAETFLLSHPDYVSALGGRISLNLKQATTLAVRLDHAHSITAETAAERVTAFAAWPFSTTYAVTRRTHLIERYERAKAAFFASFYDYIIGVQDAIAGKIGVVPGFSYVCTKNYRHSYLRPQDRLAFLRHAPLVLKARDQINTDLARGGTPAEEADQLSTELIGRRIASIMHKGPHRQPGFAKSPVYRNALVQQQIREFHALFDGKASPVRRSMQPRLRVIADEVVKVARSADNAGEAATYETLEAQARDDEGSRRTSGKQRLPGRRALPARALDYLWRTLSREGIARLGFEITLDTLLRKSSRAS